MRLASALIHADEPTSAAVAPDISVTTIFRHPDPHSNYVPSRDFDPTDPNTKHLYSRYTTPTLSRAESVLSSALNGRALVFSSGLAANLGALLHYCPSHLAIQKGYHGTHMTIDLIKRVNNKLVVLDIDDDFEEGTLCWLETPLNPLGECRDIAFYAQKVHQKHGKLLVDSTFAPPPLADPFQHGADMVMHSATKYFLGHSDALGGVLVTQDVHEWEKLWHVRTYAGSVSGSFETWLLLRSLRTLQVRVSKQAATATELALWLDAVASAPTDTKEYDGCPVGLLRTVYHAKLQAKYGRGFDPYAAGQIVSGPACFSIVLTKETYAKWLPHLVTLFIPATSLGGVESLMEQRRVSDPGEDPCLVRLSIGLEDLNDIKDDFRQAFKRLLAGDLPKPKSRETKL